MEIIKNGDIKHLAKYTTFTCPVCQCQFKVELDQYEEYDLAFDHISSTCPQCKTPVRNYFTDPEVAPIVRVYYHKKLEHQQESNLAELNRVKKKYNESFKSAMYDVIMAREQFERNHKARMAELQEQLEKMSQSDSFDNDQIDQKIKETRKALEDLLERKHSEIKYTIL